MRFWLAGLAGSGETYWLDDVVLEEVGSAALPTPSPTARVIVRNKEGGVKVVLMNRAERRRLKIRKSK